jgi:ATP-binding cassette subfamily C (CFTR/MRP) protein 1
VIRKEFADKTVIAVAHRLTTVTDFDQIIVLSNGRILETGSPKELLQKKGEFFEMVSSSSSGALIIKNIVEQL